MAERAPVRHPSEQGILSILLSKLLQVIFFLVIALIFSIIVEWIGMTFFWKEQGRHHSEAMLAQELHYLDDDFKRSAVVEQPARFARKSADLFHDYLFRKSGIEKGLTWLAAPQGNPSRLRGYLRTAYVAAADYTVSAMTITQLFAVRLAVLILALPAFLLLGMVALTDGLVQRDLRKWGGGRESSFVYHWAKKTIAPTLILPWLIYLSMPVSVHPNLVVLPFAALFALMIAVMASSFKKYL